MIDRKPLFYKCWFENNVTRAEDLLDNTGNFYPLIKFPINFNLKPLSPFILD